MTENEKYQCFCKKYGYNNKTFFNRPHWTRRNFFQLMGAGVTGAVLSQHYAKAATVTNSGAATKNTAKNVIFILLAGAPSHTDTFDLKVVPGVTPTSFAPTMINNVMWPTGLMPKLGNQLSDIAIVRSMQAHALVHSLSQTWAQIGRNPAAALGNIAPNIGSIVAIERGQAPSKSSPFPTFLALNSNGAVGNGYLSAEWAPFKVSPSNNGITYTTNPDGQATWGNRKNALNMLDGNLRAPGAPYGQPLTDYAQFYDSADALMYNNTVNNAFGFTAADSQRYGNSGTGNACLVASQVLKANQGTRFVQITSNDGWDMHVNIYAANVLPAKGALLDNAVSALIGDLKSNGLFDSTLIVMVGEFGRTVGPLTSAGGRDHYPQQFAVFAGGGVKGGTIVGQTNASGSDTVDYGWSQKRYVYPEDIEATIYSAMGIDWTSVRHDDPLGRGFEYVPTTGPVHYYPVHELWG